VCNHGGSRSQGAAKTLRDRGVDARFLVGGVKGARAGH
jgi:rhodanese-related sulfurtransferase